MNRRLYGKGHTAGARRSTRAGLLLIASAVVALGAFGVWMSRADDRGDGLVRSETGNPGAVGTSGVYASGDGSPSAGAVIHELETITGSNDGHELVGRRVDLHVPVSQHINDVAFWVGMGDNRLLVVLARDDRDDQERQHGDASSGSGGVHAGQRATVSGTIQRVPYAEAMYSWGLTNADRAELMERRIYLRADAVTPGA